MGNRYHANCLSVTSELEAVTGSAVSLDVTFVICELFLQSPCCSGGPPFLTNL